MVKPPGGQKLKLLMPICRVGIVEDHILMQEGLKVLVGNIEGFECAWVAHSAAQAVARMQELAADMLLVDISLPDRSGFELIRDLQATHPETAVLVVSMHDEELYAERALKAGARGYLMKNSSIEVFEQALKTVAQGGMAVSRSLSDRVLMAYSSGAPPRSETGLHMLSDREFEVFQLLGEGRSTLKTAEILGISPKTVDVHRRNIRSKLELEDGGDVVRYAIRWTESRKHLGLPQDDRRESA